MNNFNHVDDFKPFQLHCRVGHPSSALRARLIQFWLTHGAIADQHDCWLRTFDVVCIVVDQHDAIIGVSSVYVDRLIAGGPTYWFYRTFVRPENRVPGLSKSIFLTTYKHLATQYRGEEGAPCGVTAIAENIKFDRPAGARQLQRLGLQRIRADGQGRSVWCRKFPL